MRSITHGVVIITVTFALAACAAPTAVRSAGGTPSGAPSISPRWTSCDADVPALAAVPGVDALALPRLAADFSPTAVVVCDRRPQSRSDGGQDLVAAESRSDDVAALVSALRLPDQPPATGACTMDLPIAPWFALLDAQGRWVRPGIPKDACGKIRSEVRQAIAGLSLTQTATRPGG